MKFLWLLGAVKAQSTIDCLTCEYVWEVYGDKIEPISGESSCRDGQGFRLKLKKKNKN